jgi:hypothetical protein
VKLIYILEQGMKIPTRVPYFVAPFFHNMLTTFGHVKWLVIHSSPSFVLLTSFQELGNNSKLCSTAETPRN